MLNINFNLFDLFEKFDNLNKKIKTNYNKVLQNERENLRNMYISNVERNLNVKKGAWLKNTVRTKMYRNNTDKPHQLNIYSKSSHLIYSHYDKLTSTAKKGVMLIKFDFIKLTKREFKNLIDVSIKANKFFYSKNDNVVYVKLDKTNRRFLRKIVKANYLNLDKKEQSKKVRQEIKKYKEQDIPIPVGIVVKTKITRKNRLNLDKLKNQMEKYILNKLSKELV